MQVMQVLEKKYKVQEFLKKDDFAENQLYELLNGVIVKRSSPSPAHQIVLGKLFDAIYNFLKANNLGTIFFAPIDVFLDEENLVLPDLVFVAESKKHIITENGIEGSPDLVVEILSPSTARYDRGEKMKLYKRHQICEYWIIDPKAFSVEIYFYQNEDYDLKEYAIEKGEVKSNVLENFVLKIEEIF
jgi:Uma2 family endonuclease